MRSITAVPPSPAGEGFSVGLSFLSVFHSCEWVKRDAGAASPTIKGFVFSVCISFVRVGSSAARVILSRRNAKRFSCELRRSKPRRIRGLGSRAVCVWNLRHLIRPSYAKHYCWLCEALLLVMRSITVGYAKRYCKTHFPHWGRLLGGMSLLFVFHSCRGFGFRTRAGDNI